MKVAWLLLGIVASLFNAITFYSAHPGEGWGVFMVFTAGVVFCGNIDRLLAMAEKNFADKS